MIAESAENAEFGERLSEEYDGHKEDESRNCRGIWGFLWGVAVVINVASARGKLGNRRRREED